MLNIIINVFVNSEHIIQITFIVLWPFIEMCQSVEFAC